MRVTVQKRAANELRVEIEGEGHSFCGAIQSVLLRDPSIEFSGYNIPHPLEARPELYLRTKDGTKPEDALLKAVDALKSELNSIREALSQAVSIEEHASNE